MGVNSLSKTVTRQRRGCELNPGPSAPESSTLTTRLLSHLVYNNSSNCQRRYIQRMFQLAQRINLKFTLGNISSCRH